MMPFAAPLLETLVSTIAKGVVLEARVISTAVPVVVLMAPLVVVIVWVLSVASKPLWPASGEISRSANVIAPVFVVKLTPVPPDAVAETFPKFNAPLEVLTLIPIPVGLVIVVVPTLKLPATLVKLIPVVALFVEAILRNVAASVPVVRFNAWPLPFNVTSATLSVPKLFPVISGTALPPV
jgi:hypothetical protein